MTMISSDRADSKALRMRNDKFITEPFRDLTDNHEPFPLVRRAQRPLWQLAMFCLLFDACALCVIEVLR